MVDTCGLHQFFQTLYDNNRIFDNFITYGPMEFNVYERNSQFVNVEAWTVRNELAARLTLSVI